MAFPAASPLPAAAAGAGFGPSPVHLKRVRVIHFTLPVPSSQEER